MPWHVIKGGGCPADKPFAVIKDATGETVSCHATEHMAEAAVQALYVSEKGHMDELPNGWQGVMAPLDRPTGDGRQLNTPESGVRTRQLPMSFDWAPVREGGHNGAVMAGRIDEVWVQNDQLWGRGALDVNGENGGEFARQLGEGFAFTVSVDPDEVTFEQWFVNPDGEKTVYNDAVMVGDGTETLKPGYSVLDVMTDWRLAAVTAVSIPALDGARIEPIYGYVSPDGGAKPGDDNGDNLLAPTDTPQEVVAEPTFVELFAELAEYDSDDDTVLAELARKMKRRWHYESDAVEMDMFDDGLLATVVGSLSFPVFGDRKRKWDGHQARQNVEKWASSDGSGDLTKINWTKFSKCFLYRGKPQSGNSLLSDSPGYRVEDFKLGFVDIVDGKPYIIPNGAIGIAGGHGITATRGIPTGEVDALKNKLCSLYAKIRRTHTDFPDCPFGPSAAALVSAAGQAFRAESFANPNLTGPTPLSVTEDGRVFGHVALWGSCYMSFGGDQNKPCISIPASQTDYERFHVHGARLTDGSVMAVGAITFGDGHRSAGGLRASQKLYADVATMAAKVRAGEDEFGVWVAGEVLDEFRDRADDLLLSPLSGHWEPDLDVNGNLEMLAAHVVVVPGFKVPRLVASIGPDGEVEAFQASGPWAESKTTDDDPIVAAVLADRKAQRALRKLGVDPESRVRVALERLGVSD